MPWALTGAVILHGTAGDRRLLAETAGSQSALRPAYDAALDASRPLKSRAAEPEPAPRPRSDLMTEHALRLGTMVAMLGLVGMLLPLGVRTLQRNFLLQRSIMLQVAAPCNYGEQAYRFSPLPEPDKQGQQWTFDAMDQRCSLQPLVSSLLARSRARDPYTGRQLRILFNGDRCGGGLVIF